MTTATTTTTGHTLSIRDLGREGLHLEIGGDVDTMASIPETEIDAYCAEHGVRCTWEETSTQSYRVVLTTGLYRVRTSNGRYWQIHFVRAADETQARALVEADANRPEALAQEAADAAAIGEEPAGRYSAFRVDAVKDGYDAHADRLADGEVYFVDAGGEG